MDRCITCNAFHMWKFRKFLYCLAWFDTGEFNRLPRPNNKMHDDTVFADRFRYQLTMFEIREVIGLFRLVHANIAYKIVTTKIIAAFCRISYCLHDLIRMNLIVCRVKRARRMMVWFSMIDSDISWLMFEVCILIGLSLLLDTPIAYKYLYRTSPHITGLMRETISHSVLWWNASLDDDSWCMDGRREWEDFRESREISDIYIYIYIYIYIIFVTYLHTTQ